MKLDLKKKKIKNKSKTNINGAKTLIIAEIVTDFVDLIIGLFELIF